MTSFNHIQFAALLIFLLAKSTLILINIYVNSKLFIIIEPWPPHLAAKTSRPSLSSAVTQKS